MKKLIICGDSFMSPRLHAKDTHFSEIFSKRLNFELVSYARSAMSNGGIALQILQAIKDKPNLIFFNTTNPDRIEFSIDPTVSNKKRFIEISDIRYKTYGNSEMSTVQHGFNGNFFSDNLLGLLSDTNFSTRHGVPKEKLQLIKNYFNDLYLEQWKWQQDCMMMYYVLHQLHLSQIPYIWCHDFLHMYDYYPLNWIEDKNLVLKEFHELRIKPAPENYKDPGYHTPPEIQKIMAEFIIEHYNKYFKPVV